MRQITCILTILLLSVGWLQPLAVAETGNIEFYEDAVRRLNQGDADAALIQAKNALLENPEHLPSRILLGNIYLLKGEGANAEKELRIALELGAARDSIMLPLGDSLLLQRKFQEILDTVVPDTPQLRGVAAIYTLRARAYFELGLVDEARQHFEQAQELAPDSLGPLFGLTQMALREDNLPQAEQLIDQARTLAPDNPEAWFYTAEVLLALGDTEGALAAYSRTIELGEGHMRARLGRARLLLLLHRYDLALADARWAQEKQEYDPEPPFLASQALSALGRQKEAEEALKESRRRLTQLKTDFVTSRPGLLRVAAMLSFTDNNLEQANHYLALYVNESPYDVGMRKMLGMVRLRLGDASGAVSALYPALALHKDDPELLYLLGDALLQSGRYGEAFNLLEKSMSAQDESAAALTKLALSRMGLGESELAVADLKKALELNSSRTNLQAGVILATVYIKRGKLDEAMEVTRTLLARAPDNPLMHNLQGMVYLAMKDPKQAGMSFEVAHKLDANYTPAIYNLALIDLARGDYAAAEARYQSVLAINDEAVLALLGMSDIALQRNDTQGAISWLSQAAAQGSESLEPSIRLINLYLATDQLDKAFVEAEMLKRLHPDHQETHVLFARVQTARGDVEGATNSYRTAVRYAGFSGEDLLNIAVAQQGIKDFEGALATLQKAMDTDKALAAQAATVSLKVQMNDLPGAMAAAEQVIKELPDSGAGYLLRGSVELARKRYQQALESYRQAYERSPGRDAVMGMYQAQTLLGKQAEAREVMTDWLALHPDDDFVRRNLAVAYFREDDRRAAQREFEQLYDKGEESPVVMAHLARIYQLEKDSRARDYAQRALAGNPTWPVALDTYGWILTTEGEPEEGLKYLREAVSRDSNPTMRYHLAASLAELGRKEEARVELRSVLKSNKSSPALKAIAQKLAAEIEAALASKQPG